MIYKVEVMDLLIDHTINYLIHKVKQLKHRYNIYHSNNKAIKKITLRFGNEVKNRKRASPMAKPFWGPKSHRKFTMGKAITKSIYKNFVQLDSLL